MENEQLIRLLDKYLAGLCTEDEKKTVESWYRQYDEKEERAIREENRQPVYDRMYHSVLSELKIPVEKRPGERQAGEQRLGEQGSGEQQPGEHQSARLVNFRRWGQMAAAVLIAVISISLLFHFNNKKQNTGWVSLSNPGGKLVSVKLPDSSAVWLNARSSIHYPKQFDHSRDVFLEGEAFFEVMPDPAKAFIVHSGELQTTVLGTAFDIQAYDKDKAMRITLLRGKVKVNDSTGELLGTLQPSQQLMFRPLNKQVEINQVDTIQYVAWKNGDLYFESERFEEVIRDLERWYGVTIKVSDPSLLECRYTAHFENKLPLKDVLELLCHVNNLEYKYDPAGKWVNISGKGCN